MNDNFVRVLEHLNAHTTPSVNIRGVQCTHAQPDSADSSADDLLVARFVVGSCGAVLTRS